MGVGKITKRKSTMARNYLVLKDVSGILVNQMFEEREIDCMRLNYLGTTFIAPKVIISLTKDKY